VLSVAEAMMKPDLIELLEADIGIAAGKGVAILYRKGEVIKRVKESEIVQTILEEVEKFQPEQ